VSSLAAPRPANVSAAPPAAGVAQKAEAALIILGTLMMQNVVVFLVSGNTQPADVAAAAAGDPLARASWYPLYGGILVALALRLRGMLRTIADTAPIMLLLALMAATVVWSVAPDISMRRVIALAFTVFLGVLLHVRGDWISSLRLIGIGALIACLFHLMIIIANPSVGIDQDLHRGAWKGILHEKNALGGMAAVNVIVFGALVQFDRPWRRLWLAATALAVLLVFGSTSTTSFLAIMLVGVLFLLSRLARISPAAAVGAVYIALVGAGVAILGATVFSDEVLALLGKDPTLTGRTDIWGIVWRAIEARPLQGYGLGAYWHDPLGPSYYVRDAVDWDVPNAHNLWLDMGLAAGFPGLFGLAALLLAGWSRSAVRIFTLQNPWPAAFLTQGVLFSFSETTVLWSLNTFSTVMFVFFTAWALAPARKTA
jgi:exopolysaccharide production protein ExoQ